MYAVFRSGGKQYRAAQGDILRLEKLEADEGASVEFDEVLLVGEGSDIQVGSPLLAGSTVSARIVRQGKSAKVSVVKFRRRQNYLRQGSHRQFFTEVEITGISGRPDSATGAAADKVAEPVEKPAVTKKPAKKKTATKKTAAKKSAAKTASRKKAAKKPD